MDYNLFYTSGFLYAVPHPLPPMPCLGLVGERKDLVPGLGLGVGEEMIHPKGVLWWELGRV